MSVSIFTLAIWCYIGLFWFRYSYVMERHHYKESKKNQHCTLFVLTTLTLFLIIVFYGKYDIPSNYAYGIFWVICTLDIVYQHTVFGLAYKLSVNNRYQKYYYNNEKRFRLRVSSGFSIVFAIWAAVYSFKEITF